LRLGIFFEDFGLRERILARRGSSRKLTTLNGPIVCFLMYIPSFFLLLFLSFEGSVDGTTSFLFASRNGGDVGSFVFGFRWLAQLSFACLLD
jgi:hypothetical protein